MTNKQMYIYFILGMFLGLIFFNLRENTKRQAFIKDCIEQTNHIYNYDMCNNLYYKVK